MSRIVKIFGMLYRLPSRTKAKMSTGRATAPRKALRCAHARVRHEVPREDDARCEEQRVEHELDLVGPEHLRGDLVAGAAIDHADRSEERKERVRKRVAQRRRERQPRRVGPGAQHPGVVVVEADVEREEQRQHDEDEEQLGVAP